MRELNDGELLSEFANRDSQEAFAALVERHVALIFSAALRQAGDAGLAEEITQAVFILLARKARALSGRTSIAGWLCRTAHFTACNARRLELNRQRREQLAAQMDHTQDSAWTQLAPILDDPESFPLPMAMRKGGNGNGRNNSRKRRAIGNGPRTQQTSMICAGYTKCDPACGDLHAAAVRDSTHSLWHPRIWHKTNAQWRCLIIVVPCREFHECQAKT